MRSPGSKLITRAIPLRSCIKFAGRAARRVHLPGKVAATYLGGKVSLMRGVNHFAKKTSGAHAGRADITSVAMEEIPILRDKQTNLRRSPERTNRVTE
jgi:hypothetical protein